MQVTNNLQIPIEVQLNKTIVADKQQQLAKNNQPADMAKRNLFIEEETKE